MPNLTINLDNYSEEDQELIQSLWEGIQSSYSASRADQATGQQLDDLAALLNIKRSDGLKLESLSRLIIRMNECHICKYLSGWGWRNCPACIKELKVAVDKNENSVNAKNATPEDPIWKPLGGDLFYYIDDDFMVIEGCVDNNHDDCIDKIIYGNVFKTKESAQRMADRCKRIGIFENKMMEFADGYEYVERYCNYCIVWNHKENEWVWVAPYQNEDLTTIYMTCKNAKKAVEWANKHYPEGV